jgi:xanthine dehydrogenase accessory factor
MNNKVLIRGGGDLASGVAVRLHRAGFQVLVTELPQPLVVRRLVSFAQAVYAGKIEVEGIQGTLVDNLTEAEGLLAEGQVAVMVDPRAGVLTGFRPLVLVDARMTKRSPEIGMDGAPLVIGLGPGFTAGVDCHAVIETIRGHFMGRVMWQGSALKDTGVPESVMRKEGERVLRSPADGILSAHAEIGDHLEEGQLVVEVGKHKVYAPFKGVLRGLVYPGLQVEKGMKIGDLDPRDDVRYCTLVSDKSLAIGGAVLEAVLTRPEIRRSLAVCD